MSNHNTYPVLMPVFLSSAEKELKKARLSNDSDSNFGNNTMADDNRYFFFASSLFGADLRCVL